MAVNPEALEDVFEFGAQLLLAYHAANIANYFKGGIKLNQWLWPQSPLFKLRFDSRSNGRIADVDETADVRFVIGNNLGMDLENVHVASLESGVPPSHRAGTQRDKAIWFVSNEELPPEACTMDLFFRRIAHPQRTKFLIFKYL